MKKIIAVLICCFACVFSAAAEEDLLSFSAGLSSGLPFYGADVTEGKLDNFNDSNKRVIVGAIGTVNLNIAEPITFFTGTDILTDFNWNEENRCHILSWDFSLGLKIYPGLGGLNCGLGYVLGYRTTYSGKRMKGQQNYRELSSWGNGFKFLVEYNFAHYGNSKFLPSCGIYWKMMPRGNNYFDNNLVAYITANF